MLLYKLGSLCVDRRHHRNRGPEAAGQKQITGCDQKWLEGKVLYLQIWEMGVSSTRHQKLPLDQKKPKSKGSWDPWHTTVLRQNCNLKENTIRPFGFYFTWGRTEYWVNYMEVLFQLTALRIPVLISGPFVSRARAIGRGCCKAAALMFLIVSAWYWK